jgi:UDP-N-acetylglucosamine--N-acetylmuramyl-(pentapeptide) pyrophosphoryl-undecaprenol N-acetylglucosamine transferase
MRIGGCLPMLCFQLASPADPAGQARNAAEAGRPERVRPLRVVIAGGGTGGHLFPGIALAEEIRSRGALNQVLFISRGNEFERAALARAGFPLQTVSVEGLKGRGLWNQARGLVQLPWSVAQSAYRLRVFRPHLVIGLGSYSAGPVVMAAWLLRIPIALCEQNTLPGITNRLLARLAERIFTSFEQTRGFDPHRVLWTGNPLRRDIVSAAVKGIPAEPAAPNRPFTVLVIGGSQGAHSINRAVAAALDRLSGRQRLFFIHQTGAADETGVREAYRRTGTGARVQAFFDDMHVQYRQADLAICRAGATTVAEITALGKPAVYIPFPFAADDHQRLNAQRMVEAGAAEMIAEEQLSAEWLSERIGFYAAHPEALARLAKRAMHLGKPDAARRIVDECYRLVEHPVTGPTTGHRVNGPTGER